MERCWCGARSSKPLWGRETLPRVGSIPTHPRVNFARQREYKVHMQKCGITTCNITHGVT